MRLKTRAYVSSEAVASAWRQVLDRASLEADRPFDEAGGDSLRLLRLIFLLEESTGIDLPMDRFHGAIRPSELGQILNDALWPKEASVAAAGTVFLLPGRGGDSLLLAAFRAGCAEHLSFVTIEYPHWPDLIEAEFDLASLAQQATDEILRRSRSGPLRVAGYSLGGSVAYLTALALRAAGREIEFLGILDTDADPTDLPSLERVDIFRTVWWDLNRLWQDARQGKIAERIARIAVRELTRPGRARMLRFFARHRHRGLPVSLAHHMDWMLNEDLVQTAERAWRAGPGQPAPLADVPTVLFRSEEHEPDAPDDLSWRHRCPILRVIQLSGGHLGMLRAPHLAGSCARFVEAVTGAAPHEPPATLRPGDGRDAISASSRGGD